jgi:apolipoprotein N-acyltransferase
MLQLQYELTMKSIDAARARGEKIDLVVWPETMVLPTKWRAAYASHGRPWPFDPLLPYASLDLDPDLRDWFKNIGGYSRGARTIAGSLHAEDRAGELVEHNAAFYLAADGSVLGRYDKMFPAPMSEYTPFYRTWPAAYRFLRETFVPPGFSQFEPGEDVPIWDLDGWKLGASVCFDITFPAASNRAARNGADVIVNVSNYGWFKDSAELDLARVQTIFRAIETRRGVVACCNGGISSLVDPRGRAEDIVGKDERTGEPSKKQVAGTLLRPLVTSRAFSLFALTGDWVGAGSTAAALALAALGAARARRRRKTKSEEVAP